METFLSWDGGFLQCCGNPEPPPPPTRCPIWPPLPVRSCGWTLREKQKNNLQVPGDASSKFSVPLILKSTSVFSFPTSFLTPWWYQLCLHVISCSCMWMFRVEYTSNIGLDSGAGGAVSNLWCVQPCTYLPCDTCSLALSDSKPQWHHKRKWSYTGWQNHEKQEDVLRSETAAEVIICLWGVDCARLHSACALQGGRVLSQSSFGGLWWGLRHCARVALSVISKT